MREDIVKAVNSAQRAQRNYDLTKSVLQEDLETLIHVASNSPSKQNEVHFSLKVYTDQKKIREIYNCTKRFALYRDGVSDSKFDKVQDKFDMNEEFCVHNSQILSNVLFVYLDDEGTLRSGEHIWDKNNTPESYHPALNKQKNFSIGISSGQLILSASLLGYKTGICTAYDEGKLMRVLNTEKNIKMLVGIGFPNNHLDRRLHAETFNKDLPIDYQNGNLEDRWKFPTYNKTIKVSINDN
jgi:nitroreductase